MFFFYLIQNYCRVLLCCILFCSICCFTQTPNDCGNYSSIGTDTSFTWTEVNPICDSQIVGGVWSGEAIWTGTECSGFIQTTVIGQPVYCLNLIYGSVNLDDFATITTNTGGSLTITGTNVGVSGNVIGPYQCIGEIGGYGKVSVNVCSTIPFSVLTLTNTGCSSGWVINCAPINCDKTVSYAIPDFQICAGSMVQLGAVGGTSYQWHANPNLSDLTIANPILTVNSDETYIVDITNLYGCVISDTVEVSLLPPIVCDTVEVQEQFVNAFSPNNDNINDVWHIADIDLYPTNTVFIYNRWGDLIRTINNYNNLENCWNGIDKKNEHVVSGTYYYVIQYDDTKSETGWVQVVK